MSPAKSLLLLAATFVSALLPVSAAPAAAALPRSTPEAEGVSSAALLRLIDTLDQKIDSVHSIMIVRHGKVIAEGWWTPYAANEPHTLFSLSKSFTSTAVGIAASEGLLSIDDPVVKFFPEDVPANASENLRAMRVRDLLKMSTGQHGEDTDKYNYFDTTSSPASRFFAMPVPHKPGTLFYYNTSATYMLSAIVQKVSGQTVRDYLQPRLFEPLGFENPTWDASPQGISLGGFGFNARTEEIARFGQLLLQRGEWQGRRLVPAAWIDEASSRQASNGSAPDSDWDQGYGYQFWRCIPGFYRGDGAFGQFCIVMPQHDTVVAITSGTGDMGGEMKILWNQLLPELRPTALPADEAATAALQARLSRLSLALPAGQGLNATATRVSGHHYKLAGNPTRITALDVRFEEGLGVLTLTYESGEKLETRFNTGSWNKGNALPGGGPLACSGAWTGPNTYTTKAVLYRQPFTINTVLTFEGDNVNIEQWMNIGFGKNEHTLITGEKVK